MKDKEEEVQDTSDYKLDKHGRKIKAHRITFNKGEDDGTKGVSEHMKKSFNQFIEQHTLPLTEQQLDEIVQELHEVLGKDDSAGKWISDFVHSNNPKFVGKSKEKRKQMALAAFYAKQRNEEVELEEGWDDMMKAAKERGQSIASKTSTMTKHDVKKTSTGTVYTKQRDADGISKEFKRDNDGPAKRGRGRPKKNSFGEAVEFLMGLDEETFDSLMEEGFDSFMDQYLQLDELSKTTLSSYAKKASASAVSHTAKAQHSTAQAQDARNRAKDPKLAFARSGNETIAKMQADRAVKSNVKAGKRLSGAAKAIDRLSK